MFRLGRMAMPKDRIKVLFGLHLLLMLYSCSGILSKLAAGAPMFSKEFILCYAGIICLLGIYAIFWQQIIKRLPLTLAFANKAITVVWGLVWGTVFFGEGVTPLKVIGALVVLLGVVLYVLDDSPRSGNVRG